ncbi:MAG: 2'-5' RNA ligase family protein [Caldilineaceae bacterium]
MGFAVELHIDAVNAAPIMTLSDAIYAQCGGENLTGIGAQPHLSLTVFPELEPARLEGVLAAFAAATPPVPVTLAAVGVFPTAQGVVYLAPVVTPDLLAVHRRFHDLLAPLAIPSNAYYLPGNWMPHCTVGFELPADKIGQAVTLCQQADLFRSVTLITVRLIAFRPVRPIFTYELRGI